MSEWVEEWKGRVLKVFSYGFVFANRLNGGDGNVQQ